VPHVRDADVRHAAVDILPVSISFRQ